MGTVAGNPTGRPRKLSYSRVVELYREGTPSPQIAERFGVCHSTVLYALNRAGWDTASPARRAQHRAKCQELRLARSEALSRRDMQVRKLYMDETLSVFQVAKRLGVSRTAVRNSIARLQVKPRGMSEAAVIRSASEPDSQLKSMAKSKTSLRAAREKREDELAWKMMAIINRRKPRLTL